MPGDETQIVFERSVDGGVAAADRCYVPRSLGRHRGPTPAYLGELPTPARILAEVKGKSPEDTLGDPTYAPSSDTCAYGALAPRGAGKARS